MDIWAFLIFWNLSRLFRTLWDPGSGRSQETLSETLRAFRAWRARETPVSQKNVRNPDHHYSKKYRNTPPICIVIRLQFASQYFRCPYTLRKGTYWQYSSHLYRSTPPICIAICNTPPICIAVLLGKSWWWWSPGCSPERGSRGPKYTVCLCGSRVRVGVRFWRGVLGSE